MRPVDVGSGQPPGLQELRDQQHAVKAAAQFLPADHLQRRRLRHHVTAQRGVAAALPRPSRPGRRAPPATRSGQPSKPGGGHGMNDGLRRTQRTLVPGGRGQGVPAFNARLRVGLLCRNYVANSRIAESASVFAARICSACRLYLRGCQKAAGSRQPEELVMLRRAVPPADSAQWRPGGHGTPDSPGRLGGDSQIAPVRRALRKVSTSGRRIAGARWQPECQACHPEDDGVCSGDGQVPGAGRYCRIADAAGSRGMCRLDAARESPVTARTGRLAGRLPPCLRPLRPSRPSTSSPVMRIPSW